MSEEAPFLAASLTSSLAQMINRFAFGASLMESNLQTMNVAMCVTLFYNYVVLTFVAMQVRSLSYHTASGTVAVGLTSGHIELYPNIAPAPRAASPAYVCVRDRLAAAQAHAKDTEASLEKTEIALRKQISREQEPNLPIPGLVAKCAHIST